MRANNALMLMLGEMRSDLKWLVQQKHETSAVQHEHDQRLTKLETARHEAKGMTWLNVIQVALGLLPLLAYLAGKLPLPEALEMAAKHTTGG